MRIVVDARMPEAVKAGLAAYGETYEFASRGISYESVSGHPDIFMCQTPAGLILAPNSPAEFVEFLAVNHISFSFGLLPLGPVYPESARYNAVCTQKYLVHHSAITDPAIHTANPVLQKIQVPQGYTRCNLLALNEDQFITSDKGIEKQLLAGGVEVLYVSPAGILLPGMTQGFFGGCCGIHRDQLMIAGSLDYLPRGEDVRAFAAKAGLSVVELYQGPLFDGGGIFSLE